jgi:hypothetical protein
METFCRGDVMYVRQFYSCCAVHSMAMGLGVVHSMAMIECCTRVVQSMGKIECCTLYG